MRIAWCMCRTRKFRVRSRSRQPSVASFAHTDLPGSLDSSENAVSNREPAARRDIDGHLTLTKLMVWVETVMRCGMSIAGALSGSL